MDPNTKRHLKRAIKHFGTGTKLGEAINRSQQYVSFLVNDANKVPAEVAVDIEHATGGLVSRWQLRPDLWDPVLAEPGQGSGADPSEQAA